MRIVPSSAGAMHRDAAIRLVWSHCGGPYDEISVLLQLLDAIGLISFQDAVVKRSRAGDQIAKSIKAGDLRPLGMTLIRVGYFHDQARILIETGRTDTAGNLLCRSKVARAGAPQLIGILQWWDGVRVLPEVVVPKHLVAELNTVWALLPPETRTPSWAVERKAVGNRAEMYSVQREKTRVADPTQIFWVAQDSDDLGWDIEDRSTEPRRCIEVKGRRDHEVVFFLSDNERAKAKDSCINWEVHFWGGIDLSRNPAVEYAHLVASGYPLIIENLEREIDESKWDVRAVQWKVVRKLPPGSSDS